MSHVSQNSSHFLQLVVNLSNNTHKNHDSHNYVKHQYHAQIIRVHDESDFNKVINFTMSNTVLNEPNYGNGVLAEIQSSINDDHKMAAKVKAKE
jgi:hypothetical protein